MVDIAADKAKLGQMEHKLEDKLAAKKAELQKKIPDDKKVAEVKAKLEAKLKSIFQGDSKQAMAKLQADVDKAEKEAHAKADAMV